ncbi:3-hydroxybutyryl-CoA dehydrogenase [Pseudomonas jinjuensis]|uniref:3-hydroxybutyryl-CoA dehydrogenase n=1 Tax=Pseudomonas jinjuensis TaxID=198616 RepID=A0A1H0ELP5_9PSED|nr:3-hydroxybutyryl-CoA dehydrogenase [Pseudomonas jinjuensis]SDN83281.1 3-hydroxybutyryl-CoA dehydrogenase [Pseudomonas jinjuensis]
MQINKVGVIGAGTMGNGIAQVCAMAGLQVFMLDISENALERGRQTIRGSLERMTKKNLLSAEASLDALELLTATTDRQMLADVDLVIEAATENEELKLRLLADLGSVVRPDALIASNTSSISISKLAAAVPRPERFIGMHFFNPVPMMALVELIRGLQTSDETQAQAVAFVERINKTAISVRNSPGFAVNRILVPMLNEAVFVLQEGLASAEEIDQGMCLGCNHPIGPLALADLIGLDTLLAVMQVFYDGFNDSKYRPAPLLREMVAAGYLGRKSGRGFYDYA